MKKINTNTWQKCTQSLHKTHAAVFNSNALINIKLYQNDQNRGPLDWSDFLKKFIVFF